MARAGHTRGAASPATSAVDVRVPGSAGGDSPGEAGEPHPGAPMRCSTGDPTGPAGPSPTTMACRTAAAASVASPSIARGPPRGAVRPDRVARALHVRQADGGIDGVPGAAAAAAQRHHREADQPRVHPCDDAGALGRDGEPHGRLGEGAGPGARGDRRARRAPRPCARSARPRRRRSSARSTGPAASPWSRGETAQDQHLPRERARDGVEPGLAAPAGQEVDRPRAPRARSPRRGPAPGSCR